MPKRSYPFSESFSSQYKVHVGQKEISNSGVFGLKYRQEIYEKTKALLFNGTQAVMGRLWKAEGEERQSDALMSNQTTESVALLSNQTTASVAPANQLLLRGQTTIGLDGRLKRTRNTGVSPASPSVCGVCQRASADRSACSQCDRGVCPGCVRLCHVCAERCCSVCCVTDYSERYERILCCGCSS